ncbi:MAG: YdeI/OmpD-associated family protein [Flavobacterium sp.]|nr:YdeI/OmpD-associated family protein [Flavobacterium sp.]
MAETIYFESAAEFRAWLEENHSSSTELFVGYYRVNSNRKTMTWAESVDEALCFGWIDGRLNPVDDQRYTRRFTPRKPNSIWSNVNIKKVGELIAAGKMKPEGLATYNRRRPEKTGIYHFEKPQETLSPDLALMFSQNIVAFEFFKKQSASYQKLIIHWIMEAKKAETRQNRLVKLIKASENGLKLG